jgi:His-Xaa-Ser system radical SAM maturase HxsC
MAGIAIFNKCNNNCLMCPVDWRLAPRVNPSQKEIIGSLKNILRKNDGYIVISGGEPTLNEDLVGILIAVRKEFPEKDICLLSNGRRFAYKNYTRKFSQSRVNNLKIAIPLLGHSGYLHNKITAAQGSFQQTIAGLGNLLQEGFPIEIRVVISRLNYKHLQDIAKFIFQNFPSILYVVFIAMDIEGRVLENKKGVALRYGDFAYYLKSAVDYLLKNNIKVRLYHFPLCVINPSYWHLAWNSVEKAEVGFLEECKNCTTRQYCMGVLKTYLKNFGCQEFKAIKTCFKIIASSNKMNPISRISKLPIDTFGSYFLDGYGKLNSLLPDIFAVKNRIKPMARFESRSIKEFQDIKGILSKEGIFVNHSKYKILFPTNSAFMINDPRNGLVSPFSSLEGKFFIYISRDKALVEHFVNYDPELKLSRPETKDVKGFARALGYPDCCIDRALGTRLECLVGSYISMKPRSFYLNNMLHNVSNYYLSFHYPCSYDCAKSKDYNRRIFDAINKDMPEFSRRLKSVLKMPLLVWFDYRDKRKILDNRIMAVFDGNVDGNVIKYRRCYILKTNCYVDSREKDLIERLQVLKAADMVQIANRKIEVFKHNRLIATLKRANRFCGTLLYFK